MPDPVRKIIGADAYAMLKVEALNATEVSVNVPADIEKIE